jgi:hypothetical protein
MATFNTAYLNDQEEILSNTSSLINPSMEPEDPMITGIGKNNFDIQQDQAFGENAGLFGSDIFNMLSSAPGPGDDDSDDDEDDDLIPVKDDDDEMLEDDDDPFSLDDDDDDDDDLDDSF